MDGPFTFDSLSAKESEERKDRKLSRIEPSFFRYINNYLDGLEREYKKEHDKNPSSKRAAFLMDELRNAMNKAEELWKSREKKIVAHAQVNARKDPLPPPPENLTREESEFYHALVSQLRTQWQRFLPLRTGAIASPVSSAAHIVRPPAPEAAKPAAPPAPVPPPAESESPKDEVQTIRALVDIPPFVGFDGKTYRIKKGEVLTLPRKFASILKDRNQVAIVA